MGAAPGRCAASRRARARGRPRRALPLSARPYTSATTSPADGYYVDGSEKHDFAPIRVKVGAKELGALDEALLGMRAGGTRRVLVPLGVAGSAAQIAQKLGLGFGPSRQLERQFNRPDPDNVFFYELQLDKVTGPGGAAAA